MRSKGLLMGMKVTRAPDLELNLFTLGMVCNGCLQKLYGVRGGSRGGLWGLETPPPEIYQRSQKSDVLV